MAASSAVKCVLAPKAASAELQHEKELCAQYLQKGDDEMMNRMANPGFDIYMTGITDPDPPLGREYGPGELAEAHGSGFGTKKGSIWPLKQVWDADHRRYEAHLLPHKCRCAMSWRASAKGAEGASKMIRLPALRVDGHAGYSRDWQRKYGFRLCPRCCGVCRHSPAAERHAEYDFWAQPHAPLHPSWLANGEEPGVQPRISKRKR